MLNRRSHLDFLRQFAFVVLTLTALNAGYEVAEGQPSQSAPSRPLAYLQKHVGMEPYDLWKTQPLQRRLMALLGPEYKNLIANLDPATELAEQDGVLHTEGNAPHRGGEEEAVLLIDVPNDTIEVFLRHRETIVLAWAEHQRTVVIPHDAMDRMKNWPRSALAQSLAKLQQNAWANSAARASSAPAQTPGRNDAVRATPTLCQPASPCYETNSFSATINDFRTSTAGRFKVLTANLRITNKLNQPLTLGIVQGSGLGLDDQGNRYAIDSPNNVRGIGLISSSAQVDTKFTLESGESGDARVEMVLAMDRNIIYGTSFQLSMTLREINRVGVNQLRLGREYEVHFPPLVNGLAGKARTIDSTNAPYSEVPPPTARREEAQVPAAPGIQDGCAGLSHCYSSGPFVATISHISASSVGNFKDHVLSLDVKFRNLSNQPIILAYASGTSTALDNLGNSYSWGHAGTHDLSARGIGLTTGSSADPSFVLQPGEARNATFQVIRYRPGNAQLGTSYTYSVSVQQLEILPSKQIRTAREYSMNFTDLNPNNMPSQGINDSIKKLGDIFNKRKN
jgi:hypothetical protein